jgi:hypothetical protein
LIKLFNMEKNIANRIAALLLGTLIAATTTTVPGAVETGPIQINVEHIGLERNPWIGGPRWPTNLASRTLILGPGWMKKDPTPPPSPLPVLVGVV